METGRAYLNLVDCLETLFTKHYLVMVFLDTKHLWLVVDHHRYLDYKRDATKARVVKFSSKKPQYIYGYSKDNLLSQLKKVK